MREEEEGSGNCSSSPRCPPTQPRPAPPCLLAQDYLFARDFARVLGALLARAPAEHVDAVIDGLAALRDELRWFEVGAAAPASPCVPPLLDAQHARLEPSRPCSIPAPTNCRSCAPSAASTPAARPCPPAAATTTCWLPRPSSLHTQCTLWPSGRSSAPTTAPGAATCRCRCINCMPR